MRRLNNMKKNNALIGLMLTAITFNTYNMETPDPKKIGWLALAGATIIGGVVAYRQFLSYVHAEPLQQGRSFDPFNFTGLPEDVRNTIIMLLGENSSATSLHVAAQAINALAQTSKELHQLINDPQFCLKIIKHLAEQFNCSDEAAAQALQTKEAKHRLNMQNQFKMLFLQKDAFNKEEFNLLYAKYKELGMFIDLNFTYGNDDNKQTLLLIASTLQQDNTAKVECLLNTNAVNVNCVNKYGFTPLMLCAINSTDSKAVELLCQFPNININQQNNKGETTVMYLCTICHLGAFIPANLQILLNYGADPEIKDNKNMTPLQAAARGLRIREVKACENVMMMLEAAINKKYSKK